MAGPRRNPALGRPLTPEQLSELTGGLAWLAAARDCTDPAEVVYFDSPEARADAWRIHGDGIMSQWRAHYRRPRGWWLARGTSPDDEALELAALGELTPAELRGLAGHLSPHRRRELVAHPTALAALPPDVRREVLELPGLLLGLTRLGVEHYLGELPFDLRAQLAG